MVNFRYNNIIYLIIDQFRYFKNSAKNNRPQHEAPRKFNYRVRGIYSPEPCAKVHCFKLNFNVSELGYLNVTLLVYFYTFQSELLAVVFFKIVLRGLFLQIVHNAYLKLTIFSNNLIWENCSMIKIC